MKRFKVVACGLLILALAAPVAHGQLATLTMNQDGGGRNNNTTFDIGATISYVRNGHTYNRMLIFGAQIRSGDRNLDFTIDAVSHGMEFTQFVAMLTDGLNDRLYFWLHTDRVPGLIVSWVGPAAGGWESSVFAASSLNGIDLAGHTVTALNFHVESFDLDIPGRDPNGDGIWTDCTVKATMTVVPEPATMALLAGGLAALMLKRRCRRGS